MTTPLAGPGRGSRCLLVAVAVAAAAAALTACGQGSPAVRSDGLQVATYEPVGEGGDAALLSGTVEDGDGCFAVRISDGDVSYVPVFASNDKRPGRLGEGSTVELGGGEAPGVSQDWTLPPACSPDGPFWVVAQP